MFEMLAPTLFQRGEHPVLIDVEHYGSVAVVMLNDDPTCDELELAMCVHHAFAVFERGLLVVAR